MGILDYYQPSAVISRSRIVSHVSETSKLTGMAVQLLLELTGAVNSLSSPAD